MVRFYSEKISDTVTRIHGLTDEQMYLVEGAERAALIDTGSGVGSLRTYVEKLTDKPLIVLLTHGHVDHAMGAPEFDTVYMSRKDDYIYNRHCTLEMRKKYLSNAPEFCKVTEDDYVAIAACDDFLDLKEGDVFNLGGVTIEIFECPGHTLGSMVMLLREERTLLTGDACNGCTFLFDDYSTDLSTYESNLKELKRKTDGKYDRIYLSHGSSDVSKIIIDEVLQVCEDIKTGKVDNLPFEFMERKAVMAKEIVGGEVHGNIIYNPNRIME